MVWDGLILLVAIVLAVNGWNRGLIASWRGPIAMVAATLAVQPIYVDFATWVVTRLRISPASAVVLGYLMLWFSIEAILEIVLSMVFKGGPQKQPVFFDRLGGIAYGVFKTLVVVLLPLMAMSAEIKIPAPPPDKSGLQLPEIDVGEGSYITSGVLATARAMLPIAGRYVVSEKPPSFTPVFESPVKEEPAEEGDRAKTRLREIENILK